MNFLDLNSYVMEYILSYLTIDDIKSISTVNRFGYIITNKYFETNCVLSLPELISSDIVEILKDSKRRYKHAVYKLTRKINGNILEPLKLLPLKPVIMTTVHWENLDELVLEQYKDFQVELFPSQIKKAYRIANHVTKINFSHRPLLVLSEILNSFPNVKELHLSNVKEDIIFYEPEVITRPTNLKIVRISWGSFLLTSTLLKVFKGLTFLEFKFVGNIEFIKTLIEINEATLKRLNIQITNPEIAKINISCQLTHLKISSEEHKVSLKKMLRQQRSLRSLFLESPLLDDFLISFLENSNTLQSLTIMNAKYSNENITRIKLSSVIHFNGNLNNLIPISYNLKRLETEAYESNLKFNHLSDLRLLKRKTFPTKPHSKFDSFEDFKDYHMSEPLSSTFLLNLSFATRLRIDWIISLHEFKKICMEMKQLELFHFIVRFQDFKDFFNRLDPINCFGNLRYVVFKITVLSVHEYCVVQKVLNNSIDEGLMGDFFKPFSVFVDLDFSNQKRNIIYFPNN